MTACRVDSEIDRRQKRQGIYRIRYPGGLESDVRICVIGGAEELTIAERLYRARKYDPPFERLPWQSDYFAMAKRGRKT